MENNILCDLIIKDIHFVSSLYSAQGRKGKRRNRERWAIILKTKGETIYKNEGKTIKSDIFNPVILPKGSNYEWECVREGGFMAVEFDSELEEKNIFSFNILNSAKLLKLFKEAEYTYTMKKAFYKTECIKIAYEILLVILNASKKEYFPTRKREKLYPAVDYIAKNYNLNISNDDLSALCKISTVYFRKLFKEVFLVSPIAYIHRIRIEKAKELLKSDYGNLSDIAESIGYSDVYQFSKIFKKITGVPPGKF